jgi:hypothetical protein
MFTDLSLQVTLGSVPSSQTSLYRSPIAGAKFTDLSLQITPYKEDGKKEWFNSLIMFETHTQSPLDLRHIINCCHC